MMTKDEYEELMRAANAKRCENCEHNNNGACSLTDMLIGTTETCERAERW